MPAQNETTEAAADERAAFKIAEAVWPWASCAFTDDGCPLSWPPLTQSLEAAAETIGRAALEALRQ